ncbi:sel1 repeat family protein [Pseudomonas nicosulfuronedens]|uniref:Sel1 repeat family protein n=1 Tax=Pseudomonas nicosulfuronedens TaxID=2571105 RepID=A0A5R9QP03_9PSED|nr:sel1 repeat family protein [Pseudomonas nicosulfuronedens]
MDPLPQIRANLAFTCKHEEFPKPTADTDTLFHYARWLEKNNQLKRDPTVYAEIERLYRVAAENGHAKANINLQNGSMRGDHYHLTGEEHLRFSQQLIKAGVATGYYFVAIFLNQGAAGLREDQEMALRYYRKAADEGSANAQAYVADKLAPSDRAPDIARQMRRCAAEQGQGNAASDLGFDLKNEQQYQKALEAFQLGVVAGNETSAYALELSFRNSSTSLRQPKDLERADRYKTIWRILARYSYASPKVPEINDIVPLPPAKLPPWDGKLQWVEERKANVPPPKPSEALIEQLAKAKQLNPATGRPLPESPNFMRQASDLTCESDQACPLAGYWVAQSYWSQEVRYFKQGDILPRCWGKDFVPRIWPLPDKMVDREWIIKWGYIGEA